MPHDLRRSFEEEKDQPSDFNSLDEDMNMSVENEDDDEDEEQPYDKNAADPKYKLFSLRRGSCIDQNLLMKLDKDAQN